MHWHWHWPACTLWLLEHLRVRLPGVGRSMAHLLKHVVTDLSQQYAVSKSF